jgi:hypothetical protein
LSRSTRQSQMNLTFPLRNAEPRVTQIEGRYNTLFTQKTHLTHNGTGSLHSPPYSPDQIHWAAYCGPVALGLMGFKGDREDLTYHQAFRHANPPRKFANCMIQHILVSRIQSIKSRRQLRREPHRVEGNSFSDPLRG